MSNEPPLINPVVVIALEPVFIEPKLEVIDPPSKTPTDVNPHPFLSHEYP